MFRNIVLALLVSLSVNAKIMTIDSVQETTIPLTEQASKIAQDSIKLAKSAFGSLEDQLSVRNFNKFMVKNAPIVIIGGIVVYCISIAFLGKWCDNNLFIYHGSINRVKELIDTVTNSQFPLEKRDDAFCRLKKYTRCDDVAYKNVQAFLTRPDGLINSYSLYRKNLVAKNQFESMSKHIKTELDLLLDNKIVVTTPA